MKLLGGGVNFWVQYCVMLNKGYVRLCDKVLCLGVLMH